jgi:polyferredoxin
MVTISKDTEILGMSVQHLRIWSRIVLMILFILHMLLWFVVGIKVVGNVGIDALFYGLSRGLITGGLIFWVIVFISTLIFGRWFCGWFCWFGAYQDLVSWGFSKTRFPIPRRARYYIAFIAVVSLGMNIYFTVIEYWLENGFPLIFNIRLDLPVLWNPNITWTFIVLTLLFYGPIIMMFFGNRAWCKYMCPIGILLKVFSFISPGRMRLISSKCTGCGICNRSCDMQIDVSKELLEFGKVKSLDCIYCFKCSDACPQGAIAFTMKSTTVKMDEKADEKAINIIEKRSMKIRKRSISDVIIVILWSVLSILVIFSGLRDNSILGDLKAIMNVALLLIIFSGVWIINKLWRKNQKKPDVD